MRLFNEDKIHPRVDSVYANTVLNVRVLLLAFQVWAHAQD